jgi:TPP-dependent pyruvate/acetoin dehydrogenase alpha subunit
VPGTNSIVVSRAMRVHWYRQMCRIRAFEREIYEHNKKGLVPGTAHLYIGMEAIAVGACSAMRDGDLLTSTHRGHGHSIARGLDLGRMMAEVLGRADGYCHGKGGSMHITDVSRGMLGADGIVGGGIPIAAGAALGMRLQGTSSVVFCFFGDGASNQGSFHEAVNFAAVNQLAVIFICENNQWALEYTAFKQTPRPEEASQIERYIIRHSGASNWMGMMWRRFLALLRKPWYMPPEAQVPHCSNLSATGGNLTRFSLAGKRVLSKKLTNGKRKTQSRVIARS